MSAEPLIRNAARNREFSPTSRGPRLPHLAALTLFKPSAIVHASPFAFPHSAPSAHAPLAALLLNIAAAFIPQA